MSISFKEKLSLFFQRPWTKRALWFLFFLIVVFAATVTGLYFYVASKVPSAEELKKIQNHTASEVYSADGILLGKYFIYERSNVAYQEIAPDLIHALIATEDARFYEHNGIDGVGLLRVLVKSLLLRQENSGGGSTISQQLIKNIFPRRKYIFFHCP